MIITRDGHGGGICQNHGGGGFKNPPGAGAGDLKSPGAPAGGGAADFFAFEKALYQSKKIFFCIILSIFSHYFLSYYF